MICVSIADVSALEALRIVKANELSEVRLDLIEFTGDDVENIFSSGNKTIATFRPVDSVPEKERKDILIQAVNAGASYVDIEMENNNDFTKDIIEAAVRKKCKIIISYHNYDNTPSSPELEQILNRCGGKYVDIVKIACRVNSVEDCSRLLSLYGTGKPVIAVGMGEPGRITRIAAVFLGAPFTYASLDAARQTAPGQIEYENMKKIIDMIRG